VVVRRRGGFQLKVSSSMPEALSSAYSHRRERNRKKKKRHLLSRPKGGKKSRPESPRASFVAAHTRIRRERVIVGFVGLQRKKKNQYRGSKKEGPVKAP